MGTVSVANQTIPSYLGLQFGGSVNANLTHDSITITGGTATIAGTYNSISDINITNGGGTVTIGKIENGFSRFITFAGTFTAGTDCNFYETYDGSTKTTASLSGRYTWQTVSGDDPDEFWIKDTSYQP